MAVLALFRYIVRKDAAHAKKIARIKSEHKCVACQGSDDEVRHTLELMLAKLGAKD